MGPCEEDMTLLAVTENGFGKRTELEEYRIQTRAGKGILTYRVTEKTGNIVGSKMVHDDDEIMLISSDGTIIRMEVHEISILGGNSECYLMRIGEDVTVGNSQGSNRRGDCRRRRQQ